MIAPKVPTPTPAEEKRAYALATERDHEVCVKCRRGSVAHRDHRKNRSQGGLTLASNIQLLCPTDHGWKTTHPLDAIEEGYQVPGGKDPAQWPARRWLSTAHGTLRPAWVLYDNEGRFEEISVIEAYARMGRIS